MLKMFYILSLPDLANLIRLIFFFFLTGFSFTETNDSHDSKGRQGASVILLYHFHAITNIEIFISNFACEMTITYIQLQHLRLPDCYSMRFTTLLNYHLVD